jgi:hypothetical protein
VLVGVAAADDGRGGAPVAADAELVGQTVGGVGNGLADVLGSI